ncbi:MAG: rod shape-determining protein RodA [Paludibacteraceae bacterium]|nr:rod shape-determining protein RodA [Paludibacteraceae bacterium]
MASDFNALKYLDKLTVLFYALLVVFGCMNIYSASITPDQASIFDVSCHSGMQIVWVVFSIIVAIVILFFDDNFFNQFAPILYGAMILILIATIFLSRDINGSRSWLSFGSFSIQPAEFAKFVTALALARYVGRQGFWIHTLSDYAKAVAIIILPMLIIVFQKETGTALVFASFVLLLYREGMTGLVPLLGFLAVFVFVVTVRLADDFLFGIAGTPAGIGYSLITVFFIQIVFLLHFRRDAFNALILSGVFLFVVVVSVLINLFLVQFNIVYVLLAINFASAIYLLVLSFFRWQRTYWLIALFVVLSTGYVFSSGYIFESILQPHQQKRIKVNLGMVDDPKGIGYNTRQAAIAIGSGRLFGKGYLNGTQTRLKYVPEQHTDFIFCTVGEEWGFVGCFFLITVYTLLMWRIIVMAERAESHFVRAYAYGVLGIFAFHFFVNIGMVIGIVPVIGIPLPFISYGGSSFLGFTCMLAVLLKLDTKREERLKGKLDTFLN